MMNYPVSFVDHPFSFIRKRFVAGLSFCLLWTNGPKNGGVKVVSHPPLFTVERRVTIVWLDLHKGKYTHTYWVHTSSKCTHMHTHGSNVCHRNSCPTKLSSPPPFLFRIRNVNRMSVCMSVMSFPARKYKVDVCIKNVWLQRAFRSVSALWCRNNKQTCFKSCFVCRSISCERIGWRGKFKMCVSRTCICCTRYSEARI